jgi:hypothetical protein
VYAISIAVASFKIKIGFLQEFWISLLLHAATDRSFALLIAANVKHATFL